jgi:G3E family GTPase
MNTQTPTTIFSGFIGSGKTTIIGHLIDQLQAQNTQVVYIKNEVGDVDLDAKIMQGKNIQTRELLNGCICCTLVGPFYLSITEIVNQYHPDRILIEASGAADPSALALMVSSHPLLKRDGVIGVVDVVNFEGFSDLSVTSQNQTKFTDLIIFNKVELADLARKQSVVGYVRELNSHSPIIEALEGKVSPEVIFGLDGSGVGGTEISDTGLDKLLKKQTQELPHQHSHHLEKDQIAAVNRVLDHALDEKTFRAWLETLPTRVFRAKGIFMTPDQKYKLFNKVGQRVDIEDFANDKAEIKPIVILIGHRLADSDNLFENL